MRVGLKSGRARADSPLEADGELSLDALGKALRRKKWRIILPTLAAAFIALGVVQVLTPKYRSEARILYEGRENIFLRPEAEKSVSSDRAGADEQAVTSQVQVVLSRDLGRQVAAQLRLRERPEFDPLIEGVSLPRQIMTTLGLAKDPTRMTPEERVLEAYYDRLTVSAIEKSRVIIIDFQSQDPELAAAVANTIAETYLTFQLVSKQEQARSAGQWLAGEINSLRNKVAEAEAKADQFRSRSNLLVGTNNTTLSNQQLGEFNSQLAAARAQKTEAETKARLIREMLSGSRPLETSDIVNSELIRRLSEQRVTLRAQLAEQSATLLDGHPRIKELKAQIADLERQIRDEAEKLVRSLENDARIIGARVESMGANLDQLKRQAASVNEQDVQLRALEREAKAQRDLLESYLAKFREATTRESIDTAPSDARIISRALVSNTPFFPKKLPIVLIATLAMFSLSAGLVATGELLGGAHYQAITPTVPSTLDPGRITTLRDVDRYADTHPALAVPISSIEELAHGLPQAGDAGRRVALFGSERNVGTTMTAITLARALAKREGVRVVLIDLALDAPNLSVISSDPGAPGIADITRGTATVSQVITRDRLSRAHLVAAGAGADNVSAILSSSRLSIAMEALGRAYEHMIIDAGTVPESGVARFLRLAPKAVLIARDPDGAATRTAHGRLQQAGFADVTVLVGKSKGPETGRKAA